MKDLPKFAIAGPIGGGKTHLVTEVGKQLEHKLQALKLSKEVPVVKTLAFADPIYDAQLDLFDYLSQSKMTGRQFNEFLKRNNLDTKIHPVVGMTPRNFRQKYGTEFARKVNPNIWTDIMKEKLHVAQATPGSGLFILDVRFPNEVKLCFDDKFTLLYINTMGVASDGAHASESHFDTIKSLAHHNIRDKSEANMMVDSIVETLITYIGENYTDAGLIVPKGKLN